MTESRRGGDRVAALVTPNQDLLDQLNPSCKCRWHWPSAAATCIGEKWWFDVRTTGGAAADRNCSGNGERWLGQGKPAKVPSWALQSKTRPCSPSTAAGSHLTPHWPHVSTCSSLCLQPHSHHPAQFICFFTCAVDTFTFLTSFQF